MAQISTNKVNKILNSIPFHGNTTHTSPISNTQNCINELNEWTKTRSWNVNLGLKNIFYLNVLGSIACDWNAIKHISNDKNKLLDRIDLILQKHNINDINIDGLKFYKTIGGNWEEGNSVIVGNGTTTINTTGLPNNIFPNPPPKTRFPLMSPGGNQFFLEVDDKGFLIISDNNNTLYKVTGGINK